jgi:hypothetical protein
VVAWCPEGITDRLVRFLSSGAPVLVRTTKFVV